MLVSSHNDFSADFSRNKDIILPRNFPENKTTIFCQELMTASRLTRDGVTNKILEIIFVLSLIITELESLFKSYFLYSRKPVEKFIPQALYLTCFLGNRGYI